MDILQLITKVSVQLIIIRVAGSDKNTPSMRDQRPFFKNKQTKFIINSAQLDVIRINNEPSSIINKSTQVAKTNKPFYKSKKTFQAKENK